MPTLHILCSNQRKLHPLLQYLRNTFENIFKFKLSMFAYKMSHNQTDIPEVFNDFFIRASDVHTYSIPGMQQT